MPFNILELKALYEAKREPFERKETTPVKKFTWFSFKK